MPQQSPSGAICSLSDIPDGEARGYTQLVEGREIRLFIVRRGTHVVAYENRCPHRGTPLDWTPDQFFERDGERLICSTHGALFRLEDGYCVAGPCAGRHLTPIPITLESGWVRRTTLNASPTLGDL